MNAYEIEFLKSLRNLSSSFFDGVFQFITFFGEQYIIIVIIAIFIFVINKEKGYRIAYSIFISMCLNGVVKSIVERTRPFKVDPNLGSIRIETATGFSFPSGHTQNATVTYLSSAMVLNKKKYYIIAAVLILLVGFSRLWLGVHYPTDVLCGLILGIGCAFLGSFLHQKVENDFKKKMKLYLTSFLLFLPFILIFPFVKNFAQLNYSEGTNIVLKDYRDLYIAYAMFGGYILAVFIEHKYVDYDCTNPLKIRIIRCIVGLAVIGVIYLGLNALFKAIASGIGCDQNFGMVIFDMIRYFLVPLIGLGVYPIVTKKWFFSKQDI